MREGKIDRRSDGCEGERGEKKRGTRAASQCSLSLSLSLCCNMTECEAPARLEEKRGKRRRKKRLTWRGPAMAAAVPSAGSSISPCSS